MKMNFTESQLRAINTNKNALVSAGAGSGKTTVLSQRFMRLVNEKKAHSDEILTITFTKKATAEMKTRIRSVLIENVKNNVCSVDELTYFTNATISTVDSFCSTIVRNNCRKYGFAPSFTMVDSEDFKKDLKVMAISLLSSLINNTKYSWFFEKALKYCRIEDLVLLFVSLGDPNNSKFNIISPVVPTLSTDKYLETATKYFYDLKEEALNKIREYLDAGIEKGDNLKCYEKIYDLLAEDEISVEELTNAFEVLKSKRSTAIRNDVNNLKELRDNIKNKLIYNVLSLLRLLKDRDFIAVFYELASIYEKRVLDLKKKNNVLTFTDIIRLAVDILLNDLKIRSYYKKKFKFVMTDEFQDNNEDFRQLFYLLCEKDELSLNRIPDTKELKDNKLFMVGDEKQSIYRFRGADVSVFKKVNKTIGEAGGESIELTENFRSEKLLIDQFNKWFSNEEIMGSNNADFEADFSPLKSKDESVVKPKIIYHHQEIIPKDTTEDEENTSNNEIVDDIEYADNVESEAYSIASLIEEKIINSDYFLIPNKERVNKDESVPLRRPEYSDICILISKGTNQEKIEKALKLRGIPYHSDELKSVDREALVCDFYSIIQSCLYYDEIAKMATTNSPLKDYLNSEELLRMCKTEPITKIISYIYLDLGYRNFIISNPDNQVYEEHFKWLFSLAYDYESRGKSIVEFTDYLRSLISKSSNGSSAVEPKDLKILDYTENAVSIMTVHKSKGLEFPIVIVAQMESRPRNSTVSLSYVVEDNFLYLPCMIFSRKDEEDKLACLQVIKRDAETEYENAELKRRFYVAVTRAQYHLILSESNSRNQSSNTLTFKNLFDKCRECYKDKDNDNDKDKNKVSPVEEITFSLIEKEKTRSMGRVDNAVLEINKNWYESAPEFNPNYEKNTVSVTSFEEYMEDNFISENFTGSENLTDEHSVCDVYPLPAINIDNLLREESLQTEFGTYVHEKLSFRLLGKEPKVLNEKYEEYAKILTDNFFNSNFYKNLVNRENNKYVIKSEVPFTLYEKEENIFKEGVIDFLAESEDEFIVLDFKTSSFRTDSVYLPQITEYVKATKSLNPNKKVTGYLFYLRDPDNIVKLVEM